MFIREDGILIETDENREVRLFFGRGIALIVYDRWQDGRWMPDQEAGVVLLENGFAKLKEILNHHVV
jgi:hypothetical protein